MTMQDKEMLNELVVESREHLSKIEPDLLELEEKGDAISGDLINRVFRAVHSIKGGFGFFGIEHVITLSHAMENIMARVRDKTQAISPEVTDALLKGVDKLRVLLDDVAHAEETPIESEIAMLKPFLDQKGIAAAGTKQPPVQGGPAAPDASTRQKHQVLTKEILTEAVRTGKQMYQITVNSRTDMTDKGLTPAALLDAWEKLGDIIDVSFDFDAITGIEDCLSKDITFLILYATILEVDLVGVGTGIPSEQIFTVDLSAAKAQVADDAAKEGHEQGSSGVSNESGSKEPVSAAKSQKVESKIEDALRVKVSLLNNLMNLAGELVLSRNQLMQSVNRKLCEAVEPETMLKNVDLTVLQPCRAATETENRDMYAASLEHSRRLEAFAKSLSLRLVDVPGLNSIVQNIDMVTSLLQESIMQTRLQPISVVFAKFPRLIRDLAKKLGKEVNLTLVGQDVELDKSIVEQLSDPLTHLVRNSVDHGLETPQERMRAGKPPMGEVVLRAFHEGGKIHIQVQDDGAGVNRDRVKQKAIEKGLFTDENLAKMTDREIDGIIMLPGFSTAAAVSDVSGRGVGMDVVKTNIEQLGGTVDIESVLGAGTTITMKLPLTLAIISSLMVSAGGRRFAVPQTGIEELVRVRARDVTAKINRIKDCEVLRLREKLLPLIRLESVLGREPSFIHPSTEERRAEKRARWSDRRGAVTKNAAETKHDAEERRASGPDRRISVANALKIIVIRYGKQRYGLVVEEVYDSEEIVVKPLSGYLKACRYYAGSTIMGDGSVAMILDTNGIAAEADLKFSDLEKDIESEKEKVLAESNRNFRELLLFSAGENGNFGVDLSMVARVEKVETSRIARVGGKEFLTNEERSIRLLRLSDFLPVSAGAATNGFTFVIVPKNVKHLMGILADQVKDVVKTDPVLNTTNIRGKGIQGSTIIGSALTIVIDVNAIFAAAEPEMYA